MAAPVPPSGVLGESQGLGGLSSGAARDANRCGCLALGGTTRPDRFRTRRGQRIGWQNRLAARRGGCWRVVFYGRDALAVEIKPGAMMSGERVVGDFGLLRAAGRARSTAARTSLRVKRRCFTYSSSRFPGSTEPRGTNRGTSQRRSRERGMQDAIPVAGDLTNEEEVSGHCNRFRTYGGSCKRVRRPRLCTRRRCRRAHVRSRLLAQCTAASRDCALQTCAGRFPDALGRRVGGRVPRQ